MKFEYRTASGKKFYYESNDNTVLDENMNNPFSQHSMDWGYPSIERSEKKSSKPLSLKITLGHACNYDCSYCLQKDVGDPSERPRNMNLEVFIDNVKKNLDLSELMEIQLWGGEPFLYWNDIVPLMDFFDREGLKVLIITNGSALRQKHYEYLSKLKSEINLVISHDGPGQLELRGKDPLDSSLVVQTLKQFDDCDNVNYNFLSVVSARNYDMFSIEKFFYDKMVKLGLKCRGLSYTIGKSFETEENRQNSNSADEVIKGEDRVKFKKLFKEYLSFHAKKFKEFGYDETGQPRIFTVDPEELDYMLVGVYEYEDLSAVGFAKSIVTGMNSPNVATCGSDMHRVLSVDVLGNVRTCPHVDTSFIGGKITDMENATAIKMKPWKEDCIGLKCPVYKLCKGGCPLKIAKHDFLLNCGIESIWFETIQEAGFEFLFDEPVERISIVNRNSHDYK